MSGGGSSAQQRVLFVCMGNICRSPTAEGVFRRVVEDAGLATVIDCDSAGTHDYHIGDAPDARTVAAARRRGYDLSRLRARQVEEADFARFDRVLAMDRGNLALLLRQCPPALRERVGLYADLHETFAGQDVPDPYYGGASGFERVLDMVEAVSAQLLARLRAEIGR